MALFLGYHLAVQTYIYVIILLHYCLVMTRNRINKRCNVFNFFYIRIYFSVRPCVTKFSSDCVKDRFILPIKIKLPEYNTSLNAEKGLLRLNRDSQLNEMTIECIYNAALKRIMMGTQ